MAREIVIMFSPLVTLVSILWEGRNSEKEVSPFTVMSILMMMVMKGG